MGRLSLPLICLLLLLCLPGRAHPTTYYVATNGDNSRSCGTAQTITTPLQTINAGITCLNTVGGANTLLIRGGTYTESVGHPSFGVALTASGTSWENPVWIGAYNNAGTFEGVTILSAVGTIPPLVMGGNTTTQAQYVIYDHLALRSSNAFHTGTVSARFGRTRFQHGDISAVDGGCPTPYTDGTVHVFLQYNPDDPTGTFTETQFLDTNIHDHPCQYGFYINARNVVLDGNRIYNNAGYGIQVYNGSTACCADNITIRNNLIYNNDQDNHGHCGITLNHGNAGLIYNNVIYGNKCGIDVSRGRSNTGIYNNTVYNNTNAYEGIIIHDTVNTIMRNNIIYLNGTYNPGPGNTNFQSSNNLIEVNPQFVNAGGGDFRLQPSSLAINAGVDLSAVFTTDIVGTPRGLGGAWDLGAYETGTAPTPLPTPTNLRVLTITP